VGQAEGVFERAEFSDAAPASYRSRWLLLLVLLLLLAASYCVARDLLYDGLVKRQAQGLFNLLCSASIERLEGVEVDTQGDVTLVNAEAWTSRGGERRRFFRAQRLRLTLDGDPLRDPDLRIMRVDLHRPEIFIRRETDGVWNLEWALAPAPGRTPETAAVPPSRRDPWADYRRPDESWPRNGVHIHDGTLHVAFASAAGKETVWTVEGIRASLLRRDGVTVLEPFRGDFYGGRMSVHAELVRGSPFTLRQITATVRDADVARMTADVSFLPRPMRGRFNGVLSVTVDPRKTNSRPIAAGRAEITDGDLWELPAFSSVLHALTLTPVSEKRIDTGILEFTVEENRVRIDQMHFLGYPVSLFGEGSCSLDGDWMEVVFVPRLGKDDWNSILPLIGAPIDLLSNVLKGALVPVVLKGSFDKPELGVEPLRFLRPGVRKLIEERSPR
jgi:hypothetical protein